MKDARNSTLTHLSALCACLGLLYLDVILKVVLIFDFIFIFRLSTGAKGIFLFMVFCDFYHFKGAFFAKPGVKSIRAMLNASDPL